MQANSAPYPATFTFDPPEKIANWRPLVHWLLVIPHFVVLYLLNIVSEVIGIVSWFVILFTGTLPEGLANLQVLFIRYSVRTYVYAGFLKEEYPPFTFEMTPADPGDDPRVRVDIAPQLTNRNRLTTAFRIILVIPQFIVLAVLGIAGFVAAMIAFLPCSSPVGGRRAPRLRHQGDAVERARAGVLPVAHRRVPAVCLRLSPVSCPGWCRAERIARAFGAPRSSQCSAVRRCWRGAGSSSRSLTACRVGSRNSSSG